MRPEFPEESFDGERAEQKAMAGHDKTRPAEGLVHVLELLMSSLRRPSSM